jgi:hypothetical protein
MRLSLRRFESCPRHRTCSYRGASYGKSSGGRASSTAATSSTRLTSRALAMRITVVQRGFVSPRSTRASPEAVRPASWARSSCVLRRLCRNRRRAQARAGSIASCTDMVSAGLVKRSERRAPGTSALRRCWFAAPGFRVQLRPPPSGEPPTAAACVSPPPYQCCIMANARQHPRSAPHHASRYRLVSGLRSSRPTAVRVDR